MTRIQQELAPAIADIMCAKCKRLVHRVTFWMNVADTSKVQIRVECHGEAQTREADRLALMEMVHRHGSRITATAFDDEPLLLEAK